MTSLWSQLKASITTGDKILFLFLFFLSLSSYSLLHHFFPGGDMVYIKHGKKLLYVLPIQEDRVVTITVPEGKNTVEIKEGRVRIADATCLRKLCVQQGWIRRGALVCLPNKVIITIGSDEQGKTREEFQYDGITR